MKLSIIIPCNMQIYDQQQLEQLFISLNNQIAVNWENVEIILVYTNSNLIFNLQNYPILQNIMQIFYQENKSTGALKQFGLDKSLGTYVLFIDNHFIFYNCTVLTDLLTILITTNYNCIKPNSIQSYGMTNVDFLIANTDNHVKGKIYKKEFLQQNHLFFSDCDYGEDIYLCLTINHLYTNQLFIIQDIYFIELEPNQPATINEISNEFIITANTLYNIELITKVSAENRIIYLAQTAYDLIYSSHLPEQYVSQIENALKNIIFNYLNIYTKLDTLYQYHPKIEYSETFFDFLVRIMKGGNIDE